MARTLTTGTAFTARPRKALGLTDRLTGPLARGFRDSGSRTPSALDPSTPPSPKRRPGRKPRA